MPSTTPTLARADVYDHVRRHCFGRARSGSVGIEIELLTFPAGHPARRPASADLRAVSGACVPGGGGSVTLEPGGQVELSTVPQPNLRAALEVATAELAVVRRTLADAGIVTRAQGIDPLRPPLRVLNEPRYRAMDAFFTADDDRRGPVPGLFPRGAGQLMMCNTASLQVNVDNGPAAGMAARWRLAHALGPVLVATFANSPRAPESPDQVPVRATRQLVWAAIDPTRTRSVPTEGEPAEAWARYALEARVMLVRTRGDRFEAVRGGLTFGTWIEEGHGGWFPTLADLDYHLTTLFPPVRARGWLELRALDALPDPWWQVAVAVTVALLDDPRAAAAAARACAPVAGAWAEAARLGLSHPPLAAAARACTAAALDALPRLDCPAGALDATREYQARYVACGRSPADDLLDRWRAEGAGPLEADPLPEDAPAA